MDFTLLKENRSFDFEQYFQPIIDQFSVVGRNVEIKKKDKRNFGKVESAFLKDNTRYVALPDLFAGKMHALVFRAWKSRIKGRD